MRRPWFLVIGVALIVFDVLGLSADQPVLLVAGLASIVVGVVDLVRNTLDDVRTLQRIYDRPLGTSPLDAPYAAPYDGWQRLGLRGMAAVTDSALNDRLRADDPVAAGRDENDWRPSGDCEDLRALIRLRLDTDERKIRLATDLLADTASVTLQRTSYSAFMVTNRIGSVELRKRHSSRPLVDVDEVLLTQGRIPALKRSRCSNHLGVDLLAVTDDGRVIVTRQGGGAELSRNLLAPSGSGSADWADFRTGDDLNTVVRRAMIREMCEELGLSRAERPSPESVRLLAYARLSNLAGKPQFFGAVRIPPVTLKVTASERRYIDDHSTILFDPDAGAADLARVLDRFVDAHRSELSFPLYLNLHFLKDWLGTAADADDWLS